MTSYIPQKLGKQENWRYANLKTLLSTSWQRPQRPTVVENQAPPSPLLPPPLDKTNEGGEAIHLFNGQKDKAVSDESAHISFDDTGDLPAHHAFQSAAKDFMGARITITIKEGEAPPPFFLQWVFQMQAHSIASAPIITINLMAGAELTFYESFDVSADSIKNQTQDIWALPSYHINIADGAKLNWFRASALSKNIVLTAFSHCNIADDAHLAYQSYIGDLGFHRQDMVYDVNGKGADIMIKGAYHARENGYIDHTIHLNHNQAGSTSSQLFHGIADDHGEAVFQGKILVADGADQTDARQHHKALLLSQNAVVNAKPSLEIYADEVACAHGATVSDIKPEDLFYLKSRGLSDKLSRALLMKGFLQTPFMDNDRNDIAQLIDRHYEI